MSELKRSQYEPLLKDDMSCFHCGQGFKTIPKLKEHLQDEWNKLAQRHNKNAANADNSASKKRKREGEDTDVGDTAD